jgi:desumoylating isopeptidase 1
MYRRPDTRAAPAPTSSPSSLAASVLQEVSNRAQAAPSSERALSATESLAGPIHMCTNSASFRNIINSHRAVVVCFSNMVTCPPCRMIAPVYEQLANEKGIKVGSPKGAAFVKVDMANPNGHGLAGDMGVRVMPTFMFYLNGKKVHYYLTLHSKSNIVFS